MASFLLASLSTKNDKSFTKRIHKCIIYYRKEEKYMDENKIKKIVETTLIVLALLLSVAFYYNFDLENILFQKQLQTINQSQIEENRGTNYIGKKAGDGIKNVTTKQAWEEALAIDYITVTPVKITKTNVYSLANWAEHYTRRRRGGTGRKRNETQTELFDYDDNYRRYYVIELEDGTNILAQMNRGIANQIAKGKTITLPIGRKTGLTNTAKKLLSKTIDEMNISDTYVLYTIDDEWQKESATKIFLIKFGTSVIVFFAIAVGALTLLDKWIWKEKEEI